MILPSSDSSCDAPYTSWDMTTVSEMGPMIAVGSTKTHGLKANPIELGQSFLEQPEQGTKREKG
jgi:hypothetical protein